MYLVRFIVALFNGLVILFHLIPRLNFNILHILFFKCSVLILKGLWIHGVTSSKQTVKNRCPSKTSYINIL